LGDLEAATEEFDCAREPGGVGIAEEAAERGDGAVVAGAEQRFRFGLRPAGIDGGDDDSGAEDAERGGDDEAGGSAERGAAAAEVGGAVGIEAERGVALVRFGGEVDVGADRLADVAEGAGAFVHGVTSGVGYACAELGATLWDPQRTQRARKRR